MSTPRCLRGQRCAGRVATADDAGQATGWEAAPLDVDDVAWCRPDRGRLLRALRELPGLMDPIAGLHAPTLQVRMRKEDISGGGQVEAPILLNEQADALHRLIDHETDAWAEMVCSDRDIPWSITAARSGTPNQRVDEACTVLGHLITPWLSLGDQVYRARSLGVDRGAGHHRTVTVWSPPLADPVDVDVPADQVLTYDGNDVWTTRTGPQGAAVVLNLHRLAVGMVGLAPAPRILTPCPADGCGAIALHHQPHRDTYQCRTCDHTMSEQEYRRHQREQIERAASGRR